MIIVSVFDPSSEKPVFIKSFAYNTCGWPETKALAKDIEALLDEFSNS